MNSKTQKQPATARNYDVDHAGNLRGCLQAFHIHTPEAGLTSEELACLVYEGFTEQPALDWIDHYTATLEGIVKQKVINNAERVRDDGRDYLRRPFDDLGGFVAVDGQSVWRWFCVREPDRRERLTPRSRRVLEQIQQGRGAVPLQPNHCACA
jgi:hypothetical protein